MKNKQYHTVRTIPKSNRTIVETEIISITPTTHIHDLSPSWLSTGTFNWLPLWYLQTFVSNKERV